MQLGRRGRRRARRPSGEQRLARPAGDEHAVAEPEARLVGVVEPLELGGDVDGRRRPRGVGVPVVALLDDSSCADTVPGGAPRRGCASISSICSASGIACAIARAAANSPVASSERAGRLEPGQEPRRALEQRPERRVDRASVGASSDRAARVRSPAAGVADDPMEDARRDDPPVLGGRADVVDRCELAGEGLGGAIGGLGRRSAAFEDGLGRGGADRRGGHRAERDADVASTAWRRHRSRQASAITTLLIAWARRVPTLRNRISRPAASGMRIAEDQLVAARAPSGGSRSRSRRPGPSRSPRSEPSDERRVRGEQDRQRVAGRRGVGDVPAERAAVLDLRGADRRGRLDEGRNVLAADGRAPDVGVGRQRTERRALAVDGDPAERIDRPQVDEALRRLAQLAGQARPSGPCRRRSAATGMPRPAASAA